MKKSLRLLLWIFFISPMLFAQTKAKDTVTRKAEIKFDQKGNMISLKPETPPLIQIAGAPKAYYSYFWEFGDGNFSKEANPKHVYKKKGDYSVRLSVTNNYDNGKPPASRPRKVAINEISDSGYKDIASLTDPEGFTIHNHREPVPEQEMVIVLSYRNPLDYVSEGKLYLFYNDREFKNDNFVLTEFRVHANERETKEDGLVMADDLENSETYVASNETGIRSRFSLNEEGENLDLTLEEAKKTYKNINVLEFDNMNPGETRNVFYSFKTTPEMIKDTSATVTMRGVYVPNKNYKNHKTKKLEMEIVTSHDPNKMSSNGAFMNYRLVRFKTLNFKTRFQNDGEGPARMIRLETDVPEIFDKKTFRVVDMYPNCPICPKDEEVNYSCLDTIIKQKQIHFVFRNIYLPGSNQKNVKERDSTKGFVKYSMKFSKDFHKVKTKSRTAIIFDKNEPIITNYAVTRFLPGISIGAKAGYNSYPTLENSRNYFVGATISPFKSYRGYWQAELMVAAHSFDELKNGEVFSTVTEANGMLLNLVQDVSEKKEFSNFVLYAVPFSYRYNLNNYVGIGAGMQLKIDGSEKFDHTESAVAYSYFPQEPTIPRRREEKYDYVMEETPGAKSFRNFQTGIFADVTLGFARIGPSVGFRYVHNLTDPVPQLHLFGIWKF
jgi:hypothetical protein